AKKRERFLFGHNVIFITFVLLGEVGGFLSASSQSPTIVPHCKKPTAQTAHLVFADTQANPKNQKSCFLPTLDRKNL
ncbi:hypothetical protein PG588_11665, partial [Riemerella anatipestifer]|nr:hypothetical protein [Riemerella anatipestifer]